MAERLQHRALTEEIIEVFYAVYNELGFGFLESVYENAMVLALRQLGLEVQQQAPVPVYFRGRQVGEFRCDLLVESKVMLELKAAKAIATEHVAQTLNYLKATPIEVALILNFGEKPVFKRLVFDNQRKKPRCQTTETETF
jgi:GxxExxY protein